MWWWGFDDDENCNDDDYADDDDDDEHPWVTLEPHTLSRTFPPGSREPPIIGGKLVENDVDDDYDDDE